LPPRRNRPPSAPLCLKTALRANVSCSPFQVTRIRSPRLLPALLYSGFRNRIERFLMDRSFWVWGFFLAFQSDHFFFSRLDFRGLHFSQNPSPMMPYSFSRPFHRCWFLVETSLPFFSSRVVRLTIVVFSGFSCLLNSRLRCLS